MATKKKAAKKAAPVKKIAPAKKKADPVVFEFSPESAALIERLIDAFKGSGKVAAPVTAAAPVKTTATTTVTLTEIRETINEKAGEGKTAAVVKLLGKYGAQSASTLDEDNYEGFLTDLKLL